jgi:hypothetical protein
MARPLGLDSGLLADFAVRQRRAQSSCPRYTGKADDVLVDAGHLRVAVLRPKAWT